MSEKVKKLNHKNNITVSTVSLFDFYFDFLNTIIITIIFE